MVANPVIGRGRWTPYVTFTASSAASGYPASNLGTLPLAQVWESTGISGQWIKGDLDRERPVQLFLLCRHQFANADTFRLRLFEDAAATQAVQLYDSDADTALVGGKDIWPEVYGDELEWEDDNWFDGKYTDEEKSDTVWYRPIWLVRPYLIKSFRFDFTSAVNPLGKFRIGHLDVCRGHQFGRGLAFGTEEGYEARTTTVEAYGGADYHNRLTKKRVFNGEIRWLARDEAKGVAQELARQRDLDQPIAWLPDPSEPRHWLRDCGLYKFARLPAQARAAAAWHSVPLNLRETF